MDGGDKLVHRDVPIAILIEDRAGTEISREYGIDSDDQFIDGHITVAVAIAGTFRGGARKSKVSLGT